MLYAVSLEQFCNAQFRSQKFATVEERVAEKYVDFAVQQAAVKAEEERKIHEAEQERLRREEEEKRFARVEPVPQVALIIGGFHLAVYEAFVDGALKRIYEERWFPTKSTKDAIDEAYYIVTDEA